MEFSKLKYFTECAIYLNFTKAAEECHLAQTAMSRYISEIEAELGVKLFYRNYHSVSLTPAGEVFYTEATSILKRYEQAIDKMKKASLGDEPAIHIGIGVYESLLVSSYLKYFLAKYPAVDAQVVQLPYYELLCELHNGSIDFCISRLQDSNFDKLDDIEILPLQKIEQVIAIAATSPYTKQGTISLAQINGENIITTAQKQGPLGLDLLRPLLDRMGIHPKKFIYANSLDALFTMIEAGLGYAFIPLLLVKKFPAGIIALEPDFPINDNPGSFVAMYHKQRSNPVVSLLVETIKELLNFDGKNSD